VRSHPGSEALGDDTGELTGDAVELLDRAAQATNDGDLEAADALIRVARRLFEADDGPDSPDVANCLVWLSRIEAARGHQREALDAAQRAVMILATCAGAEPRETLARLRLQADCAVAQVLITRGDDGDATSTLAAALERAEVELGPTAPDLAVPLNLLGITYKAQARHEDAERAYHRALSLAGSTNDDLVASLHHNLGGLAHARGDFAAAEAPARRAVALRTSAHGPDHPAVAADLAALATIIDDLGRLAEAEQLYLRALDIFRAQHGEMHPEVAYTLAALGAFYAGAGRWGEAEDRARRALGLQEWLLGPQHIEVARTSHYLTVIALGRGDHAEARRMSRRALAIVEARLTPEHPLVKDVRTTAATLAVSPRPRP
jgi:tetratricopeptide (TPR) repeat protein